MLRDSNGEGFIFLCIDDANSIRVNEKRRVGIGG